MYNELSEDEYYLYSRQLLLDEWNDDAQLRLKNSHVVLIGAGGLGCSSAEILARAGVGRISVFDYDVIEISNLQRQIAFQPHDVGRFKADVLTQRLSKINPYIKVKSYPYRFDEQLNIQQLGQIDVVLDGSDRFKTRYFVNAVCKHINIPLISASAIGLTGQLLMIDAQSACYQCLFSDIDDDEQGNCATSGVLSSTPMVMASLQAHHTLLYLGLNRSPLRQKLLLWDGITMQQKIISFHKDIYCPICSVYTS